MNKINQNLISASPVGNAQSMSSWNELMAFLGRMIAIVLTIVSILVFIIVVIWGINIFKGWAGEITHYFCQTDVDAVCVSPKNNTSNPVSTEGSAGDP
jgi:hypothetical protein